MRQVVYILILIAVSVTLGLHKDVKIAEHSVGVAVSGAILA